MLSSEELGILGTLDALVRKNAVRAAINSIASRLESKLAAEPGAAFAREPVPLALCGGQLPFGIRSFWVFILRAGTATGAERHPNSHQRTMSLQGRGDFQVQKDGEWRSHFLLSDPQGPLESRWISIPINVWHQAVVGDENWVMVSFHTAPDEQLVVEHPDPTRAKSTD